MYINKFNSHGHYMKYYYYLILQAKNRGPTESEPGSNACILEADAEPSFIKKQKLNRPICGKRYWFKPFLYNSKKFTKKMNIFMLSLEMVNLGNF